MPHIRGMIRGGNCWIKRRSVFLPAGRHIAKAIVILLRPTAGTFFAAKRPAQYAGKFCKDDSVMIRAAFPGTFDPVTLGHEALIIRASELFDEVIVAVAAGVHKQAAFTLEERTAMAAQSFPQDNILVESFDGLLADFLRTRDCRIILRGLRAVSDFEFESQLAHINKTLDENIETLFLPPSHEYMHLSSTMVREIAVLGGDVTKFVSAHVAAELLKKVGKPQPKQT